MMSVLFCGSGGGRSAGMKVRRDEVRDVRDGWDVWGMGGSDGDALGR